MDTDGARQLVPNRRGRAVLSSARIARKLLAGLSLGLGAASIVFLIIFIQSYRSELQRERANASGQVNRMLQVTLENAMLKRDIPGLEEMVRRLGEQPGIAGVMIANPELEVRFASAKEALRRRLTPAEIGCTGCDAAGAASLGQTSLATTLADGREVMRSVNPIGNRAECKACHGPVETHPINGILIVDHDAQGIRESAFRAVAAMSGAGLLVLLLGLGTVWLVLRRQVLSPILELAAASRRVGEGDLGARVSIAGERRDELADLCRSFNGMVARIGQGIRESREKEAFLQTLLDTVPDGVRVIDDNHEVIMANAAYARIANDSPERLIGVPCYRIHGRNEPCVPTLVTCPLHAIKADGETIKYVHRHVRRTDGPEPAEINVETTAGRITVEQGGRAHVLVIEAIRDLDQQVRYSQEQRLSEIGQLAAGVAHEIHNPLASVRLGLQAVLRQTRSAAGIDPQSRRYLAMVDDEVEKCIRVTKRLLDLSQPPSTSMQLVSLSTVVPEVISLLHYEAEQQKVALVLDLAEEDLRVLATDSELRMLVLNLTQNAFHAMPQGGKLTITGRHVDGDVVVTFADTGVGIPADALPQIFEPFYSRRADGHPGTGLGLTICRSIVTRYRGRLEVESRPGVGTTFTVILPRPDKEAPRT